VNAKLSLCAILIAVTATALADDNLPDSFTRSKGSEIHVGGAFEVMEAIPEASPAVLGGIGCLLLLRRRRRRRAA